MIIRAGWIFIQPAFFNFIVMRVLCLFIFLCLAVIACQHKPFPVPVAKTTPTPPPPVVVCDSVNVTYAANIKPILQTNCYSCHSTSVTLTAGLDLETFSSLKTYMGYGFMGDGIFGSKFYHCITHNRALSMPPTYILDSCDLAKIRRWIAMGAPEN